jgi:hypothetical protein
MNLVQSMMSFVMSALRHCSDDRALIEARGSHTAPRAGQEAKPLAV